MKAWIMGRNSVTWQCPGCFVKRLVVALETTGRSTCKASGAKFARGQPKIGTRSHTATSWIALDAAPAVLAPALALLPAGTKAPAASDVEGVEALDAAQRAQVQSLLRRAAALAVRG
jgi:hypothetical protein